MVVKRFWVVLAVAFLAMSGYGGHSTKARRVRAHPQLTGTAANNPTLLRWLAQDAMPLPKGPLGLEVVPQNTTAGGAGADAGLNPDGSVTIRLSNAPGLNSPATLYHELGHAYDDQNLTDLERVRYRAIMHLTKPWGTQGSAYANEPGAPREQFADAYRILAQHPWAATPRGFRRMLHYQGRDGYTQNGYQMRRVYVGHGLLATYYQLRKAEKLIHDGG